MRAFLFLLIAAVAAIMLWAINSESYQNGVVFTLCTLAVGLCGYLLSDYFFSIEKKTLKQDIIAANRDVQALKDEKDLLQTQFNLATPHAQVEQLEQQLSFADEQRNKLDGLTRAQYAEISGLKSQLEMQKKNYQKLFEEGAITAENHNSQLIAIQDTLASAREKVRYLTDEGEYLRNKIVKLQTDAEEATILKVVAEANEAAAAQLPKAAAAQLPKVVAETNEVATAQLPKVVIHIPQNESPKEDYHVPSPHHERGLLQMADPRAIKSREIETIVAAPIIEAPIIEAETIVEAPIIEAETIVEAPIIEAETIVEAPIIEAETIVEAPIIEAETIVEAPIIEAETIVEAPVIEAETIVEAPIIEAETIVEAPIIEAETIVEAPIIEAETIVEAPIIEAETIVEAPVIEAETIVEAPVIEAESIVEAPVIEAESIVEVPIIEAESIVEAPVIEAESIVEASIIEAEAIVEAPIIEAETISAYDALEAELSLEKPVMGTPIIVENHIVETPTIVENHVVEPAASLEKQVVEAPSITENRSVETEMTLDKQVMEAPSITKSRGVVTAAVVENEVAETSKKSYVTTRLISPSFKNNTRSIDTPTIEPDKADTIAVETPAIPTDSTNLQAIQGIDKEIERVLKSAGIDTWQEISETTTDRLQEVLSDGKINNVDVSNWSVQAVLLADGHVNRLKTYLANLNK
jgi:predicted flap endonuclease-1-like 5' DNA nuclease